jgi:hypothetical protein
MAWASSVMLGTGASLRAFHGALLDSHARPSPVFRDEACAIEADAGRWKSNLNFVFQLSLEFYGLVSSSVARGLIPERSEASPKTGGLHSLAEIKRWNRSRTGNCGKSRPVTARTALAIVSLLGG